MTDLIKPIEVVLEDIDGDKHTFTIGRPPAITTREIISKYSSSNIPKIGDYQTSEEVMLMLMKYVEKDGIRLTTRALIDNHVPDAVLLLKLEYEAINHCTGFFRRGDQSGFLMNWLTQVVIKCIPTLTQLLPQSSPPDSHRTKNSRKS